MVSYYGIPNMYVQSQTMANYGMMNLGYTCAYGGMSLIGNLIGGGFNALICGCGGGGGASSSDSSSTSSSGSSSTQVTGTYKEQIQANLQKLGTSASIDNYKNNYGEKGHKSTLDGYINAQAAKEKELSDAKNDLSKYENTTIPNALAEYKDAQTALAKLKTDDAGYDDAKAKASRLKEEYDNQVAAKEAVEKQIEQLEKEKAAQDKKVEDLQAQIKTENEIIGSIDNLVTKLDQDTKDECDKFGKKGKYSFGTIEKGQDGKYTLSGNANRYDVRRAITKFRTAKDDEARKEAKAEFEAIYESFTKGDGAKSFNNKDIQTLCDKILAWNEGDSNNTNDGTFKYYGFGIS